MLWIIFQLSISIPSLNSLTDEMMTEILLKNVEICGSKVRISWLSISIVWLLSENLSQYYHDCYVLISQY